MEAGIFVTDEIVSEGDIVSELASTNMWWKVEVREHKGLLSGKKTQAQVLVMPTGGPLKVLHYRCADCSYVESYAPQSER
jgi:hypothetical protein